MDKRATAASSTPGQVSLTLHLYRPAGQELHEALTPPWPEWMTSIYRDQQLGSSLISVTEGRTSISAAVFALSFHLHHHLGAVSLVTGTLEEAGWHVAVVGDGIVCTRFGRTVSQVRTELASLGLLAPLVKIAQLGEDGFPLLSYSGHGHDSATSVKG